jgi:signal transduction histidine kinase
VRVGVSADGSNLIVEVSDDGVGVDETVHEGVGLQSMRQRAEAVAGTLDISPGERGGATVRAELPV